MNLPANGNLTAALDPKQLASIESVHRGFLYQHLYLVGALLCACESGAHLFVTEHDEDVEIVTGGDHFYIQIKTREKPLKPSDIKGMAERFESLRAAHRSATRKEPASFILVSNVPPGPKLQGVMDAPEWPPDVIVVWPGSPAQPPIGFPPAWKSAGEAFAWCVARASSVHGTRLQPETLVLKLAALAQQASSGGVPAGIPHAFPVSEFPDLFEQITRELQAFPEIPAPYRPQEQEPPLDRMDPVRLIIGLSGAGKGAWAARIAATTDIRNAYFDAAGGAQDAFASSLAQQVVARLLGSDPQAVAAVLFPGSSGLDSLRALGLELVRTDVSGRIVVDNAHLVDPDELLRAIGAAPQLRWVLLAQPGPASESVRARLSIVAEPLLGWSDDTIADVMAAEGSPADASETARIRRLTAGLPLFVQSAARLAADAYGGDVARLCTELESASHFERTAQEAILERSLLGVSESARSIAEMLALAAIPLTAQEIDTLADAAELRGTGMGPRAVRELMRWGITRSAGRERVQLHDAFRIPALAAAALSDEQRTGIFRRLAQVLEESLGRAFDLDRARRYLLALPEAGEYERLAEVAGNDSEQLLELGLGRQLESILRIHAGREDLPPHLRFWMHDALAFWHIQTERYPEAEAIVAGMDALARDHVLEERASLALHLKHIHLCALRGDVAGMAAVEREARRASLSPSAVRIIRYNVATGLLRAGDFPAVERVASDLADEYDRLLGLSRAKMTAVNVGGLTEMLAAVPHDPEDVRRLADCLDLLARARDEMGIRSGLARFHAVKLYQVSGAFRSAVKSGQDLVDEILSVLNDPPGARQFMEDVLLPIVHELELHDHVIPVRAQYAVVLARSGEIELARAEVERLRPYVAGAPGDARAEFLNQAALIERIARHPPLPTASQPLALPTAGPRDREARAIGRNQPCPCGSGRKFKKCCGAP